MHSRASKLRAIWLAFTFILVGCTLAVSQNKSLDRNDDQQVKRQANATAFSKMQDSIHTKNQIKAKAEGIRLVENLGEGRKLTFQHFNELGEAMYLSNYSNRFAGQMTRTDQLYKGGSLGLDLTGGSDVGTASKV